ncbi:hypothetical protein C8R43DRAFT_1111468 [Mycena crocata]|nr:hypothetical protein C8R43DRAFT_1111468 [Mycena crocata]
MRLKSTGPTAIVFSRLSMTTQDSNYPSAFRNTFATSDVPNSEVTPGLPSQRHTGQIASFILLVAGLEAQLIYDPVFFNWKTSLLAAQTPIGSGTFFSVERAEWRGSIGRQRGWAVFAALKYVRRREVQTEFGNWKQILLEMRTLMHEPIRYHPNIVRLLGLCWGASPGTRSIFPVLVLEYAEFGSLAHLQANNSTPFSFAMKKKLCHDVAKGLAILHACDIVHGDLKHENVLVFRNKVKDAEVEYTAKLADFGGSAMDIQEGIARFLPSGTPPFDAPEVRNGLDGEGLKRTDIYSLGLLVWRVFFDGRNPFSLPPLATHSLEHIQELKRRGELLPIAKISVRELLPLLEEFQIADFVLENTLQAVAQNRSLIRTIAALQVHKLSEIHDLLASVDKENEDDQVSEAQQAPGAHGVSSTNIKIYLARENYGDHDYQHVGPGYKPKLPAPDPDDFLFDPQRLQPMLDWSLQAEIVRDLEDAATAPSLTSTTQVRKVLAAFYLFRSYVYEFGVEFNPERACHWLREAALSPDECQENYLAQAWCWRIHKALGQPLNVEFSVLRDWMMLSIVRGHRRCIADSEQIISLLTDEDEKGTWQKALSFHIYVFLNGSAGIGMPYFMHRKLRRVYDLDDLDALDRDIQAEFALRGLTSVDQIYVNHRGDGLLHIAAGMGKLSALEHIIANYRPNIDLGNQARAETPLLAACRGGHLNSTLFLLQHGAEPDGGEWAEETPLYWLCSFTPDDMAIAAHQLVVAGASLSQSGRNRKHTVKLSPAWADPESLLTLPVSPLSRAVIMQSVPAVKTLLSLGADPLEGLDSRSDDNLFASRCPVVVAAILTMPQILLLLLSDSRVSIRTPLISAADILQIMFVKPVTPAVDPTSLQSRLSRCGPDYKSAMLETLRILHSHRLGFNFALSCGAEEVAYNAVVAQMVSLGRVDVVDALLQLGYSVHGTSGASPIVEAVKLNHSAMFHLLVAQGANLYTTIIREDGSQMSLLQVLADRPPQSRTGIFIAEYLIKMGVPVDPPADGARSAFALAVKNQIFDLAELLAQYEADVNFSYCLGPTCGWITVLGELIRNPTEQNLESVKFLLNPKMRPASSLVDVTNNLSVLHFAAIFPPKTDIESAVIRKMIACILDGRRSIHFATINSVHPDIGPPLWAATICCNQEVVSALLESGADTEVKFMGHTPSEVAAMHMEEIRAEGDINTRVREELLKRWTTILDLLRLPRFLN